MRCRRCERLDGNAAAGLLAEIFAFDVTVARAICAGCGAEAPVGELAATGWRWARFCAAPPAICRWCGLPDSAIAMAWTCEAPRCSWSCRPGHEADRRAAAGARDADKPVGARSCVATWRGTIAFILIGADCATVQQGPAEAAGRAPETLWIGGSATERALGTCARRRDNRAGDAGDVHGGGDHGSGIG